MQVTEEDYQLFKQSILRGDAETANQLIKKGVDVNRPLEFQMTNGEVLSFPVIFAAIDHNHLKAANMLIDNGAKLDVFRRHQGKDKSVTYITPLYKALDLWKKDSKLNDMVTLLINNGADLNYTKKTVFKNGIVCITPALLDIFECISIKSEIEWGTKDHPPVDLIIESICELDNLLIAPPDQGKKSGYPFLYTKVEQLVKNGANVNQIIEFGNDEIPLLYFAIIRQDEGLVKTLLTLGASWNVEIKLRGIKKCPLRKFPFDRASMHDPFYMPEQYHKYRCSDPLLRFLKENGWKGEGIFGWRG